MENFNCDKWFYTVLALLGLFFVWSLIIFRYYLKANKKGIELGRADKEHDKHLSEHQEKIKKLEEKNGKELREIEGLKIEIKTLKGVIENLTSNKQKSK